MDAMHNTYHEATKHSYMSVRQHPNYLDWSMQPSPFKVYEGYPLIPLDTFKKTHRFIYLLGGINAKKIYPGVSYYLRTIPSAGALYPTEIYLQMRGVKGFEDGIYHFSVAENGLRLLYRLGDGEGVEYYFKQKRLIEGIIVLYSSIYYRSSWKYKNRAFRYCLLDGGHALGALEMSALLYEHAYHIHYDFDKASLNEIFGFAKREFFLSYAIVGVPRGDEAKRLGMRLSFVDGTKHFAENDFIYQAYEQSLKLTGCRASFRFPKFSLQQDRLYEAIMQRRSARAFQLKPIKKEQLDFVLGIIQEPIPSDCDEKVAIYYVVNRVEGVQKGLYKNSKLIKAGDFSQKVGYLCLEQALGSESAVTFFLTSSAKNYQPSYQKAGHIGHRCYIASEYLGLGCSGIGAYYDDEVREFLQTDDMVLYALAIGKKE